MFKKTSFEIGILNCVTGKYVKKKTIEDNTIFLDEQDSFVERVLTEAKRIARWFDRQNVAFLSKPFWEHLEFWGKDEAIRKLVRGKTLTNVIFESAMVEDGGKDAEHEFYVKRIEGR